MARFDPARRLSCDAPAGLYAMPSDAPVIVKEMAMAVDPGHIQIPCQACMPKQATLRPTTDTWCLVILRPERFAAIPVSGVHRTEITTGWLGQCDRCRQRYLY